MKKIIIIMFSSITFILFINSCSAVSSIIYRDTDKPQLLSEAEIVSGLKEALKVGALSASASLSKNDGYFGNMLLRLTLPPEANDIIKNINKIPGGEKKVNELIVAINRAAEDSAKEVVPIFEKAIKEMTLKDSINILKGNKTAATDYFKSYAYNELVKLYAPKINNSLNKPLVFRSSANKIWNDLVAVNNDIVNTPIIGAASGLKLIKNTDLGTYCTEKALDGLFYTVGEEEAKIRKEPLNYTEAIIQKVFGALKSGLI